MLHLANQPGRVRSSRLIHRWPGEIHPHSRSTLSGSLASSILPARPSFPPSAHRIIRHKIVVVSMRGVLGACALLAGFAEYLVPFGPAYLRRMPVLLILIGLVLIA